VELFGELLAFLSGALLLRPAVRVNSVLRDSAALQAILQRSKAKVDQQTIPKILGALKDLTSSWDKWDDRCLKWGAGLFAVSGLVKLVLAWSKP
jgi:hypothetical protein